MLPDDTLRTSYARLTAAIEDLFYRVWGEVRDNRVAGQTQPEAGSTHRMKDKAAFEQLLTSGWDTPVAELTGKALVKQHH
jgi:methionyl-tRNA formyltransferase